MFRLLAIAALAVSFAFPALAEGFYKGKTITYIIATNPGGNYDAYARLIGRHLSKALGANKVLFKNVPGAGHIIGTNTLAASKPDGLTIGTFNTGLIYAQILQRQGIQFDLDKLSWIGKAAADARVMVLGTNSGLKSFDDLLNVTEPKNFAASGVGSASFTETKMLADAMDLKINMIPGFQGNEGEMAMLRQEVVGQVGSYGSLKPFIDAGSAFVALAIGGDQNPQAMDYAKTPKAKSIVSLIKAMSLLGRLSAMPPGVDPAILQEMRDGYMKVMKDPDFLAEATKLGLSIEPENGEEVAKLIHEALQQDPETVALIAEAVNVEIPTIKASSKLLTLEDSNKVVEFNSGDEVVNSKISGSRTKITINGADADRKQLVVGMECDLEFDPATDDNELKLMSCKGAAVEAAAVKMVKASSKLLSLEDRNKIVEFNSDGKVVKASISGSRTKITIGGAEAERKSLSVGMECDIQFEASSDDIELKTVDCKG